MVIKLAGIIKESKVDFIIYESKPVALHFLLENKVLILDTHKRSLKQDVMDQIVDKDWRPELEYLSKAKFGEQLHKFKYELDFQKEED